MNKKILSVVSFLILISPAIVFGAIPTTITGIVANVGSVISTVALAIAIIFWIITGLLFLTALGDPGKVTTARKALIAAIVGTAVALLAGTASVIIGNALSAGV